MNSDGVKWYYLKITRSSALLKEMTITFEDTRILKKKHEKKSMRLSFVT